MRLDQVMAQFFQQERKTIRQLSRHFKPSRQALQLPIQLSLQFHYHSKLLISLPQLRLQNQFQPLQFLYCNFQCHLKCPQHLQRHGLHLKERCKSLQACNCALKTNFDLSAANTLVFINLLDKAQEVAWDAGSYQITSYNVAAT